MKTHFKPWILVSALLLAAPLGVFAQETLGGLGAAGAAGASLGAAGGAGALTAGSNARGRIGGLGGSNLGNEMGGDPRAGGSAGGLGSGAGTASGSSGTGGGGSGGDAEPTPTPVFPKAQNFGVSGASIASELLRPVVPSQPALSRKKRSPRAQALYSARTSRQTKRQRTRAVQSKYKIPPVAWRAAYLPQDRYKFGKIWKFVSTETDRYYYTPSAMARRRFSPNRVIGFYSYQDALAAGYRPDPVSKPAPGAQIAYLARLYRGPALYRFIEFAYSGQFSEETITETYNYAASVDRTLRPTRARPYIGYTVGKILESALTGDTSQIPTSFNSKGPVSAPPPATSTGAAGSEGSASGLGSGSSDPRSSGGSSSPSSSRPALSSSSFAGGTARG